MKFTLKDKAETFLNSLRKNDFFFERHKREIENIVIPYVFLKENLNNETVVNSAIYRWTFCALYGITPSKSSKQFVDTLMGFIVSRKINSSLKEVIIELEDKGKPNRYQVSFVSKALNLLDDNKYAIFDSRVKDCFNVTIDNSDVFKSVRDERLCINTTLLERLPNLYLEYEDIANIFREKTGYTTLSTIRIMDIVFVLMSRARFNINK